MKTMEHEIIFGGSGGQGVLLMGELLGNALSKTDFEVLYYTSYGGEVRGGSADVFLTVSREQIGSPIISEASVLAGLSFYGLARYQEKVAPGGLVLVNSPQVPLPERKDVEAVALEADGIAAGLGAPRAANMVMLGGLVQLTGVIDVEAVTSCLDEVLPPHRRQFAEVNRKALMAGAEAVSGSS
jgi:2-oxoglutarate ferredoxin oxidoreductase subunit gamma